MPDVATPTMVEAAGSAKPARSAQPFKAGLAKVDWHLVVDILAITMLAIALVVALLPPYGPGWIWLTVLGGTALGIGIGLVSQSRRFNPTITAAIFIAVWFIFGGLLAMPDSAIWGFIPTSRTLLGLASGPVTAWRDMLTVAPPLGTTYNLMTIPLLLAMTSSLLAITLARRSKRPTLAWLPQSLAICVAFALGNVYSLADWIVAFGVVAVILFWTTYQRRARGSVLVASASRNRGLRLLYQLAVFVGVAGLTFALAPLVEPNSERKVLRESIAQPLEVESLASPLLAFRGNITNYRDKTLMTVEGADGKFLRIATLDAYDGLSYNISNSVTGDQMGEYLRVGSRIEARNERPRRDIPEEQFHVTINELPENVWLPTIGKTKNVKFEGPRRRELADRHYHNLQARASVVTVGLESGDSYVLTAQDPNRPTERDIRNSNAGITALPEIGDIPDTLRDRAGQWVSGALSAGEAAIMVESRFANDGYFSHGVEKDEARSLPGHSYSRIYDLIIDQDKMVGNEEQYAVAMALMMRARGIPARVAYGYLIPPGGQVKGEDVRAYTEVYLTELGWVMFNPTPDHDRKLPLEAEAKSTQTRPHVENPPPPPERPDDPPPDDRLPVQPADPPVPPRRVNVQQVLKVTATYGLPLIVLVGPMVLILGLKQRRRKGRMRAEIIANRVAGGWAELLDAARDLGVTASPMATRTEQAAALTSQFPKLAEQVDSNRLARQADAAAFAPDQVSEQSAENYWHAIDEGVAAMRGSVSKSRAMASRLSIRSFRGFQLGDAGKWVSDTWASLRAQRIGRRRSRG